MTSPYYNNLDMIMFKEEEEHFVKSINDYDDREIEYVISEQDNYVQLAKFNWTKERGLLNDWRIFDMTAKEVWDDLIEKEIVFNHGVCVTLGDEFERYAEDHSHSEKPVDANTERAYNRCMLDKNDLKVGMRVIVFENGKNVDIGTVIEIEDGFVSMVEGDEGFGYEMDRVEFAELN